MIRTQIYLPNPLYQRLQLVAERENKPTAKVVRELLSDSLATRQRVSVGQALSELVKVGGRAALATCPATLTPTRMTITKLLIADSSGLVISGLLSAVLSLVLPG